MKKIITALSFAALLATSGAQAEESAAGVSGTAEVGNYISGAGLAQVASGAVVAAVLVSAALVISNEGDGGGGSGTSGTGTN